MLATLQDAIPLVVLGAITVFGFGMWAGSDRKKDY